MNFIRSLTRFHTRVSFAQICRQHQFHVRSFASSENTGDVCQGRTIYALSSGHGKCGVSVIRVSGPKAHSALQQLCKTHTFMPRKAILCKIFHPKTDEHIDTGLVLWFPPPHSFTGEACCELQIHGGSAVIAALLDALSCMPGLEPAEAGQFTMRAFKNNKLDLTEVEGLADLIHAETESQRKQALRQMEGSLSSIYDDWRKRLVKCVANSVAYIDFSEEENIEDNVLETVHNEVCALKTEVKQHLSDNRRGERLRNGIHVTIVGEPNVGKSSLLNLLSQRPAAIVSPIAGTTRDVIETALDIAGYPVLLSDTAGLRETQNVIEKEGVARAFKSACESDIKVVMMDATKIEDRIALSSAMEENIRSLTLGYLEELGLTDTNLKRLMSTKVEKKVIAKNWHKEIKSSGETIFPETDFKNLGSVLTVSSLFENSIIVFNKVDKIHKQQSMKQFDSFVTELSHSQGLLSICTMSCTTEEGVEEFLHILKAKLALLCSSKTNTSPSLTQARHRYHLTECFECLVMYLNMENTDIVLATEALRNSLRHIGKITGEITSEEILDVVFRDFCIGK